MLFNVFLDSPALSHQHLMSCRCCTQRFTNDGSPVHARGNPTYRPQRPPGPTVQTGKPCSGKFSRARSHKGLKSGVWPKEITRKLMGAHFPDRYIGVACGVCVCVCRWRGVLSTCWPRVNSRTDKAMGQNPNRNYPQ